jgi:hypothetical protein
MWGNGYGLSHTAYHPKLDYMAYAEKVGSFGTVVWNVCSNYKDTLSFGDYFLMSKFSEHANEFWKVVYCE